MTEKEFTNQMAEIYRGMGCPKLAEYLLRFGGDSFGTWFGGPTPEMERFAEVCLKEGHPMSWYDDEYIPKGAIL